MTEPLPSSHLDSLEAVARAVLAVRDRFTMACPDKPESPFAVLTSAAESLRSSTREVERLREALLTAREGLSIAAGWARSKPDSQRARDKIKAGLDAIRQALSEGEKS